MRAFSRRPRGGAPQTAAPRAAAKRTASPGAGISILCLLFAAITAFPADPDPASTFTIETASGKSVTGPLRELAAGWSVRVGETRIAGTDVVSVRHVGKPLPAGPLGDHVIFAGGDRLPGTLVRLEGERVQVRRGKETLALPLSALSVLWFASPDGADPDRLRRRLATEARTRDVVRLRNGDSVEGVLTRFDARTVRLEVNGKELNVERDRVAVVALNTELTAKVRPKTAFGRLILRDGTRLALVSATCADGKTLSGETLFKSAVSFPVEDVVALDVLGGPAVSLSELPVRSFEHTPYLGTTWPYVLDGSADRRDLRLGGSTYDRGIGMHTASRLTYDLAGRYRRFEARVGLDDRSGKGGTARVRVLVDGKPTTVTGDQDLSARTGPLTVRVDVAGAKELTLVADFGARGGVEGHVNWADARLVK